MVHPVESVEERGQRRVVGHVDGLPPGGAAQLLRGRGEAVLRTPAQDDLRSGGDGLVGHPQPDARSAADQDDRTVLERPFGDAGG
ncbi:hypothetical protein EES42_31065 [Streptomyces sp. ADI95-17]|nr:hypothetical protein EES42_31065 [Streptomyces sp. ADI95-17]